MTPTEKRLLSLVKSLRKKLNVVSDELLKHKVMHQELTEKEELRELSEREDYYNE
jgi:hypothetical protein